MYAHSIQSFFNVEYQHHEQHTVNSQQLILSQKLLQTDLKMPLHYNLHEKQPKQDFPHILTNWFLILAAFDVFCQQRTEKAGEPYSTKFGKQD